MVRGHETVACGPKFCLVNVLNRSIIGMFDNIERQNNSYWYQFISDDKVFVSILDNIKVGM